MQNDTSRGEEASVPGLPLLDDVGTGLNRYKRGLLDIYVMNSGKLVASAATFQL